MTVRRVTGLGLATSGDTRKRGVPLRVSLVVLTLTLVVIGLMVSGIAVTSAMRSDLINRVDSGLSDAVNGWAMPKPDNERTGPRGPAGPRRPPSQYFVRTTLSTGSELTFNDYSSAPDLSSLPTTMTEPITVSADGDGPDWRVISRESSLGQVVVGMPLNDVDATLSRLIWLQLGIGAIVVVALGLLSYLLVASSLRPLRRVEETAHAIASGDLTERVPAWPANTEVGSLSASLNTMLGQIQRAFRATEASERQARQSEEQARASEEKMRRFIADASHELRTPLTSIKGFADLMNRGVIPDRPDAVRRISAEADRMNLLVEDLLMLARLDAHRPLAEVPVEMLTLVHDAVAAARAAAPARTIDVDDRTGDDEPVVVGDAARLTQVLRNLIGNAIVHTPADAEISVEVSLVDDDVRVAVVDTGPGLSEDDAEHVFERFYRGDSSRHREVSSTGSGLGLSIVAALVVAHGGQVGVDSAPGAGAAFWFRMPLIDVSA
ncbi:MAG: HAMP domain-containing sensor histidine kinase [Gordonia sp. (in: high G+C Gram-positive bacteria)]